MAELVLPSGETVEFGEVSYSRACVELLGLYRKSEELQKAVPGGLDEASKRKWMQDALGTDGLRMMELVWELSVQSLVNAGRSREAAEAVMAQIPLNTEWLDRLRDAVGLG